ncbi:SGNH/GDSL hydrolase family protein [Actinomycetospora corticicola]|uniref:SGNH/GDSL hydrolase family protein n=1 Tax=Actinomycetospora corticicola TaxID=663602 RepID=UPI003CCDF21B
MVKVAIPRRKWVLPIALILVAATFIVFGFLFARSRNDGEVQARKDTQIGFLGDSITAGVGASDARRSYTGALARQLGGREGIQPGVNIVALGGASTAALEPLAFQLRPDSSLVVVAAGTNDITRSPIEQFRADFERLLRAVRSTATASSLVCLGAWGTPRNTRIYDDVIRDDCQSQGGLFVPISDLYVVGSMRGARGPVAPGSPPPDDFHPNDAGHAAIASRIAETLSGTDRSFSS